MLSGIGPAEHLQHVGVAVKHDLPGVGEHLIDHPEGIVLFEPARPIPPMASNHLETGLFSVLPGEAHPEIEIMFSTTKFDGMTAVRGFPTAPQTFSFHPNVARARSTGTMRLRSARPQDPPIVDPAYYTDVDGHDERVMLEAVRLSRQLARQEALAPWVGRELAPGPAVHDDEQLLAFIGATSSTVFHPAGTCRMAACGSSAVVDSRLRVHGLDRLRVADASVFPDMPTVNPCLTVMMVGERCSQLVLRERRMGSGSD